MNIGCGQPMDACSSCRSECGGLRAHALMLSSTALTVLNNLLPSPTIDQKVLTILSKVVVGISSIIYLQCIKTKIIMMLFIITLSRIRKAPR